MLSVINCLEAVGLVRASASSIESMDPHSQASTTFRRAMRFEAGGVFPTFRADGIVRTGMDALLLAQECVKVDLYSVQRGHVV